MLLYGRAQNSSPLAHNASCAWLKARTWPAVSHLSSAAVAAAVLKTRGLEGTPASRLSPLPIVAIFMAGVRWICTMNPCMPLDHDWCISVCREAATAGDKATAQAAADAHTIATLQSQVDTDAVQYKIQVDANERMRARLTSPTMDNSGPDSYAAVLQADFTKVSIQRKGRRAMPLTADRNAYPAIYLAWAGHAWGDACTRCYWPWPAGGSMHTSSFTHSRNA